MRKTTAVQRQRRARSFASFVAVPHIDGKFRDYHGNPAHAPKRWKRLWARQWRYMKALKANIRAAQRAAQNKVS